MGRMEQYLGNLDPYKARTMAFPTVSLMYSERSTLRSRRHARYLLRHHAKRGEVLYRITYPG